jgi:hypothetical protein
MFRQRNRTYRHNRLLAGYLAFIGGFVNAAGLVLVGSVTSHVMGNVTHFAKTLAAGDVVPALVGLRMIGAFFAGAFVASMMIESAAFGATPNAYGAALALESMILAGFVAIAVPPRPRRRPSRAWRWGCRTDWSRVFRARSSERRTLPASRRISGSRRRGGFAGGERRSRAHSV